jgi:hypothetical protein
MRAKILKINSAPYGQYDTEIFAIILDLGTVTESILRGIDLPLDLKVGDIREVVMYKHLIEKIGSIV